MKHKEHLKHFWKEHKTVSAIIIVVIVVLAIL